MYISSGIYRLAQVIKWDGRVLGGAWFIAWFIAFLTQDPTPPEAKIIVGVVGIVFVVITEGIAWILKGFANE